jgi:mannose-6-phosphate isomerase-like protein (cupin superfamily)
LPTCAVWIFSEPHAHANGEAEIYFVIEGTGKVGVGNEIKELEPGAVIVTPPDTPHGMYSSNKDIVLAVVNLGLFTATQ